jgi:gas vesicle protein
MKLSDISDLSKEDVLSSIGLATKRSTTQQLLSAFGFFGVGLVVGAATALLFATRSGQGLREDIGERLRDLRKGDGVEAPVTSDSRKEART